VEFQATARIQDTHLAA